MTDTAEPYPPVLLFFEDHFVDRFVPYDRHVRRLVKRLAVRVGYRPRMSGFQMWFKLLVDALVTSGYTVEVNNRRLAEQHPDWPVGLVGYPCLLDGWDLPNLALLGPALFDHPTQCPGLMDDQRFRFYLVTCSWMEDLFRPSWGDRVATWYAGIDPSDWNVPAGTDRDIDVLVYDKIRWNRETLAPTFHDTIASTLLRLGLRSHVVRYGSYAHDDYRDLLRRSRSMVFLCEHETQGMAYQEALASGVPVIAWDNGYWLDPAARTLSAEPVPASSVPYFSTDCGEKFTDVSQFDEVFSRFWSNLESYRPRRFVETQLSVTGSAEAYMTLHRQLLADASDSRPGD